MRYLYMLLLLWLPTGAQNLIPNPSFEAGPWATSYGWAIGVNPFCTLTGVVSGPTNWTVAYGTPDRIQQGTYFCHWDVNTPCDGYAYVVLDVDDSGISNLLDSLVVGDQYYLSYCVQSETFRGALYGQSVLGIYMNPSGNIILSPPFQDSLSWRTYDTTFVATYASTAIEFKGYLNPIDVDNVVLIHLVTLPINLGNISWKRIRDLAQIEWTTESESNSDWFYVEQMTDTFTYYTVASLPAAGNSTSQRYYQAQVQLRAGENYFRLSQKDMDGKKTVFKPFRILYDPNRKNNILELYNILGQLLKN